MRIPIFLLSLLLFIGCRQNQLVDSDFHVAEEQTRKMLAENNDPLKIPRTVKKDGSLKTVGMTDWTSGFFAGTLWYLYEYTQDSFWKEQADKWTMALEPLRHYTDHHDIGFMIGNSFGNGYRLTDMPHYKEVLIDAANSLATRFRPQAGIIQSWEANLFRNSTCPVIVDNMMNLELLFLAYRLSGDSTLYNIAVSHADRTIENHFRNDYSSYHVVDYDPVTGEVLFKATAQGYADESAWGRGQSWALYGFTLCYRETKDPKYLQQAIHIADFILNHASYPEDGIPYWDYDAPNIPDEPRDVSAATILASGLLELSTYTDKYYFDAAEKILKSLSTGDYLAIEGGNGNFILKKSVGSAPAKSEVSVPLNYADYYFLEALLRYKQLK